MIKVLFVVHSYENEIDDPDIFLDRIHTLREWTESLTANGITCIAYLRYHTDRTILRNNIKYVFIKDQYGPLLKSWQIPHRLHDAISNESYDVIHLHNLNAVLPHYHLLSIHKGKTPVVIQNHGEQPDNWIRTFLQKRLLKSVSGVFFNSRGQEDLWVEKKVINPEQVYIVPEASTMMRRSLSTNDMASGELTGKPNFLWVGHLNRNKDPLTILIAFREIIHTHPEALLSMIFREEDKSLGIRELISNDKTLKNQVILVGEKSREELVQYYSRADYFILGSHREYTGYSAMEAIACGLVPILTDIPAFRRLTDDGRVGKLFKAGNHRDLLSKMKEILSEDIQSTRKKTLAYFNEHLSYEAITPLIKESYQAIIDRFQQSH